MSDTPSLTAFSDNRLLARGGRLQVAMAIRDALVSGADGIAIFDDSTGRAVDLNVAGTHEQVQARYGEGPRGRGRPKLGVTAREVTLLPRHWQWLESQPGGASVALRKLVEAARRDPVAEAKAARGAADGFMLAMLGDQPGYEEAARALYAGDSARFRELSEDWPTDLRDHARRLAEPGLPSS